MDDRSGAILVPVTGQLALHARSRPGQVAYTFLRDDGRIDELTLGELGRRACALAGQLAARAAPGERALLLYRPGLEFIVALFGCMLAGLAPVPATLADRRRAAARLRAIAGDAAPALVLTSADAEGWVRGLLVEAGLDGLCCACSDGPPGPPAALAAPDAAALAFVQYTSGSTAEPKGVEVTHANLAANIDAIRRSFGFTEATVMVSWLPLFHDMGLVGSVLAPAAIGFHCVLMAPALFLRQPGRWLRAISDYRGTCAGAPDFGWDYCIDRVDEAAKDHLDLSCIEVAYNGAEPVRASTLRRFAMAFARCGFREEAQFPCYGMAEATLLIAGGPRGRVPLVRTLSKSRLEGDQLREVAPGTPDAREVVSCGPAAPGVSLAVVDPASGLPVSSQRVGEIWVAGPAVARGYRNRPRLNAEIFGASIGGAAPGKWLRTGDLGFVRDGELYITGRLKDLVIVNGRNIYPQDVEEVVERTIAFVGPNTCAAFSIEHDGRERLSIVIEADRALARAVQRHGGQGAAEAEGLARQARAAVAAQFGVAVACVLFVRPGSFPRTTSGKVQRARCKALAQSGALEILHASGSALGGESGPAAPARKPSPSTADAMIAWLRQYAARRINSRLCDERRTVPPYVLLDLGNQGFFGLQAPLEHGGRALSHADLLRVLEQLAAVDLTLATIVGVHNGLGMRPLLQFGPESLHRALLPQLASGRQLAAYALTEPVAGSNPQAIQARAEKVDGGWRLSGDKHLVGLASWAGVMTVLARACDADGAALGPIALLVPEDTAGVVQGPEAPTMGMRGMVQNAVRFERVFVPDSHVLRAAGEGMQVAHDAMGFSRLGIGALCVGAMKRCAQLMARYAARREVVTGRLIDNAVTCARLHETTCAIWALEALSGSIAALLDARAPLPQHACLACKCLGSELLWEAADRLVQMLGGRGYVETNIAPQLLRDARVLRILEGPTETLFMHLGAAAAPDSGAERFIGHALGRPALAAELGTAVTAIRGRAAATPLFAGGASAQWLDYRVGELCAWAVLLGAAEQRAGQGGEDPMAADALAWTRRKFRALRRAIADEQEAGALGAAPALLSGRIDGYAAAIGDIEQQLPGEATGLDPLLQRVVPAAPAQAPSETRQLVRDSVAKWLRADGVALAGDTPFTELGIDSLATVPIALELERRTALAITPDLLFDCQTVNALADYIDARRDPASA